MTGVTQAPRSVAYRTASGLTVKRLQPAIGAQIEGADLCKPLPPRVAQEIRQALLDHGVIFFRNQPLAYPDHIALARIFGEPVIEGIFPDRPEVMSLESTAEKTNPAGGSWHSDGTYLEIPPALSILHALIAAPLGGDTCFSSAVAAYEGLSDAVKARIAPLRARASMAHIRKIRKLETVSDDYAATEAARKLPDYAEHPVVRIHPETDKRVLYVNEGHTAQIVGLGEQESADLLRHLVDQFKRPEYQLRWSWTDHAVAIWDNRQVQHYAVTNEAGPRHVERVMVQGTPTIGLMDGLKPAAAS